MVLKAYQLTTTITHGGVKMFVKNFFKNLGGKIKNSLSKSKCFFENIWNTIKKLPSKSKRFLESIWGKIKNFFSKHKLVFQSIQKVLFGLLMIAFGILQLYQFSQILLMGLKENSAFGIAFAIAGYFLIGGYAYWFVFHRSYDNDFRRLEYDIRDIRLQLELHKINLSSSNFQIHTLGFKHEMFELDLQRQLRKIERKLDELRVKEN